MPWSMVSNQGWSGVQIRLTSVGIELIYSASSHFFEFGNTPNSCHLCVTRFHIVRWNEYVLPWGIHPTRKKQAAMYEGALKNTVDGLQGYLFCGADTEQVNVRVRLSIAGDSTGQVR